MRPLIPSPRQNTCSKHDDNKFKSPYAEVSSQGPTITDRRLFFIEETASTAMIPAANTINVKPRLGDQDKKPELWQLSA